MPAVNEAYRVLGDPGRRAIYDRSLRAGRVGSAATSSHRSATRSPGDGEARPGGGPVPDSPRSTVLSPSGPARVPWKLMAVAAVVGSVAVVVGASFDDPPSEEPPDGILRAGSCVEIEANGDAREIACTGGDADIVVELVLPTGAPCPRDLLAHRDRLGLGTACIVPGR
jgi:molecular chaperone DnaJ